MRFDFGNGKMTHVVVPAYLLVLPCWEMLDTHSVSMWCAALGPLAWGVK